MSNSKYHSHQAVHWIDGMKISSQHFLESDSYHIANLQNALASLVNDFNYGLLSPIEGSRKSLDYDLNIHPDRIEVHLKLCHAITRGGSRINYSSQTALPLQATVNASDYQNQEKINLFVFITSNPFERVPTGEPDPAESPLRHPHSMPSYRMEIMPEGLVNLNYTKDQYLAIGRIIWQEKTFHWDEGYYPPCTSPMAEPQMERTYEQLRSSLEDLKKYSIQILRTAQGKATQSRPDFVRPIAKNTSVLCQTILHNLADQNFRLNNTILLSPPYTLVEIISGLAGRLMASLETIPQEEAERLLAYFYQWTASEPNQFRQSLNEIADVRYDHLHSAQAIHRIHRFTITLTGLWKKLSLLQFIGQDEKNLVIGIESDYQATQKTNHSLL